MQKQVAGGTVKVMSILIHCDPFTALWTSALALNDTYFPFIVEELRLAKTSRCDLLNEEARLLAERQALEQKQAQVRAGVS